MYGIKVGVSFDNETTALFVITLDCRTTVHGCHLLLDDIPPKWWPRVSLYNGGSTGFKQVGPENV